MKRSQASLVIVTIVITIIAMIVIGAVAGLVVIYTGIPNVAATRPHGAVVAWILSTTADRSVQAGARRVRVPADYEQISARAGYYDYDNMCVMCHGAPGLDRQWVGKGLYPQPPFLYRSVRDLSPAEVFWVIRNGIKDTGMPALMFTYPDDHIWRIAALVKRLPAMTPEQYKALGQGSGGTPAVPGTSTEATGVPLQDEDRPNVGSEPGAFSPGR